MFKIIAKRIAFLPSKRIDMSYSRPCATIWSSHMPTIRYVLKELWFCQRKDWPRYSSDQSPNHLNRFHSPKETPLANLRALRLHQGPSRRFGLPPLLSRVQCLISVPRNSGFGFCSRFNLTPAKSLSLKTPASSSQTNLYCSLASTFLKYGYPQPPRVPRVPVKWPRLLLLFCRFAVLLFCWSSRSSRCEASTSGASLSASSIRIC
mmetsp:Transcript_2522/g.5834  ORF Transcript_2522/g.5834 Transcript_2522/m.5834 type:complete len:206 (-) Transcript_2522:154-771(-)